MFKIMTYQLPEIHEIDTIKKIIYMLQNQTDVKKVELEPVEGRELFLSYLATEDEEKIKMQVTKVIEGLQVKNIKKLSDRSLYQFDPIVNPFKNTSDISSELIEKGWVKLLRNGEIGYSDPLIKLMRFIDDSMQNQFSLYMRYQSRAYSAVIPNIYLQQMGYLENIPQTMFFMSPNGNNSRDLALQTAPCFKIYFELEDQTIHDNNAYTVIGPCFRNEPGRAFLFETLTYFHMREFVFIGSREYVLEASNKSIGLGLEWLNHLGLTGNYQKADDPFFITNTRKEQFVIPDQVKLEIRCPIPGRKKDISIGSFDVHGNFFSNTFNIKSTQTDPVWTGCMGFGIERCMWAILQQLGLNTKMWPLVLREVVDDA